MTGRSTVTPEQLDAPTARPFRRLPLPALPGLKRAQDYAIVVIFLLLFIALSLWTSAFLTKTNLVNVLDQNAAMGALALGETFAIISGNFDLSVGSVYSLAGIVGIMLVPVLGPVSACVIAVLCGTVLGIMNGGLVVLGRVHSFIATLATQYIIYGLALVVTGGVIVLDTNPGFLVVGQGRGGGVEWAVWIMLGLAIAAGLLLARSVFGRYVYAVGGNREAARLSGVRIGFVVVAAFAISGTTAAIGGILAASLVGTAQAGTGTGLVLPAIASVIIGGTSIFGGEGAIWRTVLGVLLFAMIGNGFALLSLNATYQEIVEGALIIIAVVADAWARSGT
ncbi:MAG: ABC transporter permease [Actinomycetota bacterium]|jgi:ribose transport system permease protein|nr:ABC transporter permease [Actinomycetota bacterium]